MHLQGIHRYRLALAFLLAASIPAIARAQSGHAGHGQHDHGGTKAAPPKPTPSKPADRSDGEQLVSAADASMGGHDHGDMNSRFHMEMTPTRVATREDSARAERL